MPRARILLVEDEPSIRELLAEVLAEADLDVAEAGDGEQAMLILDHQGRFDLLLTDVHMPGRFDGVDVARRARALDPGLPVVFATGRPDTLLPSFGELGPGEVCLTKPFSPREALCAVGRLLAARVD